MNDVAALNDTAGETAVHSSTALREALHDAGAVQLVHIWRLAHGPVLVHESMKHVGRLHKGAGAAGEHLRAVHGFLAELLDLPGEGSPNGRIPAEVLASAETATYAGIGGCLEIEFDLDCDGASQVEAYPLALGVDDESTDSRRVKQLIKMLNKALNKMDFATKEKKQTQILVWKRMIGKSFLTKREAFALMGFFRKLL